MEESLNVVALISGGKDSLYSLLHCHKLGHTIVALANLYPPPQNDLNGATPSVHHEHTVGNNHQREEQPDLNSFMYQTVGHSLIPLYAEALELPLYRQQITGNHVQKARDYSYDPTSSHDETEDLVPLLQMVRTNHPEANAICTGAILSTYQRTRIESVALRLNLIPLSYLWQYPILPPPTSRADGTTGLLEDMYEAGCDARLIKIASGGVSEKLLWSNVAAPSTRQRLANELGKFFANDELGLRGAVVGEGGEFETLAISGPRSLWKGGTIEVDTSQNQIYVEEGTSYLRPGKARVVQQAHLQGKGSIDEQQHYTPIPVPALLDHQFETATAMVTLPLSPLPPSLDDNSDTYRTDVTLNGHVLENLGMNLSFNITTTAIQINNITCLARDPAASVTSITSSAEQMIAIAMLVPDLLTQLSERLQLQTILNTDAIVSTTLLIRDMSEFANINSAYARMFSKHVLNPPARVTIAAPLPDGVHVSLSMNIYIGTPQDRTGLHVQSRSFWAPANIGPYSQAIAVPLTALRKRQHSDDNKDNTRIVHMAGQIPLLPATMRLLDAPFVDKAALSLQHLWRVAQEQKVDAWSTGVALLGSTGHSKGLIQTMALDVERLWCAVHEYATTTEDDEESDSEQVPDIWDLRQNRAGLDAVRHSYKSTKMRRHLHSLPTARSYRISGLRLSSILEIVRLPPLIVAEVTTLPRDAAVEWWSTGLAGLDTLSEPTDYIEARGDGWEASSISMKLSGSATGSSAKFITYNILHHGTGEEIITGTGAPPVAMADLIHCFGLDPSVAYRLVSGYAFVPVHNQRLWSRFRVNTQSMDETNNPNAPAEASTGGLLNASQSLLGDGSTTIPCFHLWGHIGRLLEGPHHGEPNSGSTKQHPHADLRKLDLAFVLRIETE